MSRLVCTFRRFLEIIDAHGFQLHRKGATSHKRYRGVVKNKVQFVDVAAHNPHDEIKPGTLDSMIRQSGLNKKLFRK